MQQRRCHIGKGMRLNQSESTCLKSWAGLGKMKLLLCAAWNPWWGLAPPHSSSLTGLWLPLMSNFAIAMWRAAGILPWQGMGMAAQHWVSLLSALGEPTGNVGEGNRVLVGVKCASPKFTCGVGWPAGSQGAGTEGRCSTARPERLWVLLTG